MYNQNFGGGFAPNGGSNGFVPTNGGFVPQNQGGFVPNGGSNGFVPTNGGFLPTNQGGFVPNGGSNGFVPTNGGFIPTSQQQQTYVQPTYTQPQQTYVQPQQTYIQPTFTPTYTQPQQTFIQPTFTPTYQQPTVIQTTTYQQPQVITKPVPTFTPTTVTITTGGFTPMTKFNPHCPKCYGKGIKAKSGKVCKRCYLGAGICFKCQGSGITKKGKHCKLCAYRMSGGSCPMCLGTRYDRKTKRPCKVCNIGFKKF